jgi:D-isomer specific 2-hydroxyacid dehydrogenase-like protein
MPSLERVGDLPVVVALGSVDPGLVSGVLDGHCRFVATPGDAELAVAEGAIARADAQVDRALLGRAPALRVIARTGVGTDLIDLPAATARGVAVVITPGPAPPRSPRARSAWHCIWSSGSARLPRWSATGAGPSAPASA